MKLNYTWSMLLCVWLGVSGCGGPAAQLPPQQVVTQVDSQSKQGHLQEQLLKQVAQISVGEFKDYKIGAEDVLGIMSMDTDKLNSEVRVNGQGEISLQLVGVVPVAGLTTTEVEKKLIHLYKENEFLTDPHITVAVKEYRYQRVAVSGAVNKPDQYALIGPRTLLEVLGMAGGLSDRASEVATIIRSTKGSPAAKASLTQKPFSPGTETIVVDLNRLLLKGAMELNYPVQNGDVVFVPYVKTAHVLGAVTKPGSVPLKNDMTVTKAIAEAGGLHLIVSSNNVTLLRLDENGQREVIPVNLAEITSGQSADPPLKENDIVFVQESGVRRFLFDFKMFLPGSFGMSVPQML
jgi:polysaccharide biosynthesis/export protein